MSDKEEKRYDVCLETRRFEIDLFWKRSLFFWGFISAAFLAYAEIHNSPLAIITACFGMVCSCAWTLSNRGSKYWQECWETKVEQYEKNVTGLLFGKEEKEKYEKGCWLRGRQYSVSKLTIALSDYVFILWAAITLNESRHYCPTLDTYLISPDRGLMLFVIFSFLYLLLLFIFGRRTSRYNRCLHAKGDDS